MISERQNLFFFDCLTHSKIQFLEPFFSGAKPFNYVQGYLYIIYFIRHVEIFLDDTN